jgi:hypothetical protein
MTLMVRHGDETVLAQLSGGLSYNLDTPVLVLGEAQNPSLRNEILRSNDVLPINK